MQEGQGWSQDWEQRALRASSVPAESDALHGPLPEQLEPVLPHVQRADQRDFWVLQVRLPRRVLRCPELRIEPGGSRLLFPELFAANCLVDRKALLACRERPEGSQCNATPRHFYRQRPEEEVPEQLEAHSATSRRKEDLRGLHEQNLASSGYLRQCIRRCQLANYWIYLEIWRTFSKNDDFGPSVGFWLLSNR